MTQLHGMYSGELSALVTEHFGMPAYRARQLAAHLARYDDFDEMSDLPKDFRAALASECTARPVEIVRRFESKDGTVKYLFGMSDGNVVEGAFMPQRYGNTLCVSTQVGCRMGCAFCASGIDGLNRNLTAAEILGEVLAVNRDAGGAPEKRAVTNVVLMGSGEPLDNYDEVTRFLRLVSEEGGINISERNISLSTCGLADKVRRLADDGFTVTLSFSLHATTDEARRSIMPIANKYAIAEIFDAAKYYFSVTGRRVIFEYTMIKGVNTTFFDVKRLAELTRGFPCHVNLISLNPVKEKHLEPLSPAEEKRFLDRLTAAGVSASVRRTRGADVSGACGQLRRRHLGENLKPSDNKPDADRQTPRKPQPTANSTPRKIQSTNKPNQHQTQPIGKSNQRKPQPTIKPNQHQTQPTSNSTTRKIQPTNKSNQHRTRPASGRRKEATKTER